jgi:hypothetical protein
MFDFSDHSEDIIPKLFHKPYYLNYAVFCKAGNRKKATVALLPERLYVDMVLIMQILFC